MSLQTTTGDRGRISVPHFARTNGIPKIIHQTFHTNLLASELQGNVDNLKRLNPDWEHRFYDLADITDFISQYYGPSFLEAFSRINPTYHAAKSDLFRYLVLYRFGGVYLDVKSVASKPFSAVIRPDDQYLLSRWNNSSGDEFEGWGLHQELRGIVGGEFQQWQIASVAGHPFLGAVIGRVLRNIRGYNPGIHGVGQLGVLRTTGPIAYTLAIDPLRGKHRHRIVDSRRDLGLEYSIFGKEGHKAVFGRHYSELSVPLTPISRFTQFTARAVGCVKWLRRIALRVFSNRAVKSSR